MSIEEQSAGMEEIATSSQTLATMTQESQNAVRAFMIQGVKGTSDCVKSCRPYFFDFLTVVGAAAAGI